MDNLAEYLRQKFVLTVGGTWIAAKEMISGKKWDAIRANAQAAREKVSEIRGLYKIPQVQTSSNCSLVELLMWKINMLNQRIGHSTLHRCSNLGVSDVNSNNNNDLTTQLLNHSTKSAGLRA